MFGKVFREKHVKLQNEQDGVSSGCLELSKDLKTNYGMVRAAIGSSNDIIFREFKVGVEQQVEAFLVMLDILANKKLVGESLMKPLMQTKSSVNKNNILAFAKESVVSISSIDETKTIDGSVDAVLSGNVVLFFDGSDIALVASIYTGKGRDVTEPSTEMIVRGPREGFVETVNINLALIRRKIKNPNLSSESIRIGRQTKTDVLIVYIKGITDDAIVKEVKARLKRINIDSVLESGYLESYIEDAPLSIFATVGNTEKPDILCAKLLEGRVAILTDGTPIALTVPYVFAEAFQASEDYYSRPYYASFIRLLRWIAFCVSVYLPSIYVALTAYHQELIPSRLVIKIATETQGLPFPAVLEAFLMQVIFEVLREAGVRMPRPVGQAVSIVGALVLGESAVSAGLIGAPMVIIVAFTAISSFLVIPVIDIGSFSRLLMIILAGFAGIFGIILGTALIMTHMCSLRSYGIPYMSPIAPMNRQGLRDVFIRAPWWAMQNRPAFFGGKSSAEKATGSMPRPPKS